MIPIRVAVLVRSLGRTNDHEVIATVRAIGAALRSESLDFHDLADLLESARACSEFLRSSSPSTRATGRPLAFGDMARACRDLDGGRLNPRERSFVQQMCAEGFTFRPTSPQAAWLTSIFDRLQARAAA